MPNTKEIKVRALPEKPLIPNQVQEVIISLLGKCGSKDYLEGLGAKEYEFQTASTTPQQIEKVLISYTTVLTNRETGSLTPEKCQEKLDDLANSLSNKSAPVRNLAFQLSNLNEVSDLVKNQEIEEAKGEFVRFAESWGFNPEKPQQALHQGVSISHPLTQAMTFDLAMKIYPDLLNTLENQQIKLGLCWHFLPHDQLYTARALVECLDSFASFISTEEDGQARATPVWETTTQLAESINDSFTSHTHTT